MNRFENSFQALKVAGQAPRPSLIYTPGLPTLPRGTELYKVAGGGTLVLDIKAGDRLTVIDLEGGQACEIVAAGGDGRCDPSLLGATEAGEAQGIKAALASDSATAARSRKALARRHIDLGNAKA